MIDYTNNCQCCNRILSNQTTIKIACGHFVCYTCYEFNTKSNKVQCPCCSQIYYINQCFTLANSNIRNLSVSNPAASSIHQPLISKIEKEMYVLENMLAQAQKAQDGNLEIFKQYSIQVKEAVLYLSQTLEAIQNSILSKIEEIKGNNQSYFMDYSEDLKNLMEKRKKTLDSIMDAKNKGGNLDFSTQIEVNSLQKIESSDISFYKLEFSYDIEKIGAELGNSLILGIKFPIDSVKIVPDNQKIPEQNPLVLKNNDQELVVDVRKPDINLNRNVKDLQPSVTEIYKKPLIEPSRKSYLEEYRYPQENEFGEERGMRDSEAYEFKWFIEIKGKLKKLPIHVCKQIEAHKHYKDQIYIKDQKKNYRITNHVDLKNMKYCTLDKTQQIMPDKIYDLIYLSDT